ncbi:MAG: site-2 protease family protein [Methanomassiliicoccaceae archaeon]|nr:site-2 protease family protein [Methanomassiliicoccaceae archaeon]
MELNYIILLILAIIYVPFYIWVRRSPNAKKRGLVKYGPTVMIKTTWGTKLMDRWSKYKRFWKFFGTFSLIVSFGLMAFIVLILIVGILNFKTTLSAPGLGVEAALAIPGINPFLPFWYAILGLVVAMVIHELAHGFQTRANNMRVDSTGLLYGVVPLGAFVEPNEEDIKKSSRRAKLDLYSAGITMNFVGAVVAFFIFAVIMLGGISTAYGDDTAVLKISKDYPEVTGGIPSGAIILLIDGEEYSYTNNHEVTHTWSPGDKVTVTYLTESGEKTTEIFWGLLIEGVTENTPASGNLSAGTFILTINSTPIYGYSEFLSYLKTTSPGDTAVITRMGRAGEPLDPVTITLGDNGGIGFVGVKTSTSGMSFTTPNIMLEVGRNPIYGADGVFGSVRSMMSYIGGPLSGFSPMLASFHWMYDVPLGGAFWILVSVFYWIFWLNIMLGVANAIPAFPFDGGFIFQGGMSAFLQRLGMKDEQKREERVARITGVLSMAMVFMLILVIFAAVIQMK